MGLGDCLRAVLLWCFVFGASVLLTYTLCRIREAFARLEGVLDVESSERRSSKQQVVSAAISLLASVQRQCVAADSEIRRLQADVSDLHGVLRCAVDGVVLCGVRGAL